MKQILVSGSSAYDNIHHFDGLFSDMDISELSNMSILSSKYTKNHWGTWANIAYNLALLWENAILLTTLWDDYNFSDVIKEKINLNYVHIQEMSHSAHWVIISDNDDNRITIFHPWAMEFASSSKVEHVQESCSIWIVSANHIPTMLEHAEKLQENKVPFFVDPSQQVSQMSREDIIALLNSWTYLISNHNEFTQIIEKTLLSENEILAMFDIVIVTHGSEWLHLFQKWKLSHIWAIDIEDFEDTTGAWDALRAGILYGLTEWQDIETACKLWTILASYCILSPGSQQHHFSIWNVMEDMKTHFDIEIDLFVKRKY